MKIVIGLCGAKGSGKTTVFNSLKNLYEDNVAEITLAKKLKDVCSSVFYIPRDHFDSHLYKEKDLAEKIVLDEVQLAKIYNSYDIEITEPLILKHVGTELKTPRYIAQYIGTEVLRAVSHNIHCEAAVKQISADVGIVTDLRFPDELNYFKNKFDSFFPIYIKNEFAEGHACKDLHESERHLYDLARQCPIIIENNQGKKEFEEKARKVIEDLINQNIYRKVLGEENV